VIDVANARYMAERIPGAKLVELAGVDHSYIEGDREALLDEVEVFLTGARHVYEPERMLITVLFADIVGSTERATGPGNNAWRELLAAFFTEVRDVLQQYRGREINTSGDGILRILPESRCTSARLSRVLPRRVKCWFRRRCAT